MNKRIFIVALLLSTGLTIFTGCKSKTKKAEGEATNETTTEKPASAESTKKADASGRYTISFMPDTVALGKKNELFIKLNDGESVDLSDPDGKSTGGTLTINFTATNKNKIGEGSGLFLHITDQRLMLDNGSQIPANTGTSDVTAQESSSKGSLEFNIPAGAKPVKLNLFEDGTRSTIELTLTKK